MSLYRDPQSLRSSKMKLFATFIAALALANLAMARPYMASWNGGTVDPELINDEVFKRILMTRLMRIFPGFAQQLYMTYKQTVDGNTEQPTTTSTTTISTTEATTEANTTVPLGRRTIQIYLPPKPAFSPYG